MTLSLGEFFALTISALEDNFDYACEMFEDHDVDDVRQATIEGISVVDWKRRRAFFTHVNSAVAYRMGWDAGNG